MVTSIIRIVLLEVCRSLLVVEDLPCANSNTFFRDLVVSIVRQKREFLMQAAAFDALILEPVGTGYIHTLYMAS